MHTLEGFANSGGMIPEQVWDAPDIPDQALFCGRPSGSAMPLVWAHAEYVKLCRSLHDGRVFDMPPQTVQRYVTDRVGSPYTVWRSNLKCRTLAQGTTLRVEVMAAAVIHWSTDGWQTARDTETRDTGLGMHIANLPTDGLTAGSRVVFTFRWEEAGKWEGTDYEVCVADRS
jgi:glucoamylase